MIGNEGPHNSPVRDSCFSTMIEFAIDPTRPSFAIGDVYVASNKALIILLKVICCRLQFFLDSISSVIRSIRKVVAMIMESIGSSQSLICGGEDIITVTQQGAVRTRTCLSSALDSSLSMAVLHHSPRRAPSTLSDNMDIAKSRYFRPGSCCV